MTNSYKLLNASARFFSFLCGVVVLTGLFATSAVAQVGPPTVGAAIANGYSGSPSSGTYTAITGGTVWQSGTTINTDAVNNGVALGFTFRYNGRSYTTVNLSNNGFITFGANGALATTYTALSTNTNPAYDGAVAGFAANLGAAAVGSPEIRYETVGTSPNREFVVQYQNVRSSTGSAAQTMTFQIRLAETTNQVRIVYGACASGTATLTGQVGLKGGESSDINNRTGTNWTALTAGTTTTSNCTFGTTGGTTIPANGLTFTYVPGTWVSYPATYAALGAATETFDSWVSQNVSGNSDAPGASWRTWPSRGDNSVRISSNAISGFTSLTGWTSTSYAQTVSAPGAGNCARFHDGDVSTGSYGYMDYFVNLSTNTGTMELAFDMVRNQIATSPQGLQIQLSTDGGVTFTNLGALIGGATSWTTITRQTTSNSSTAVFRFLFNGNFSSNDYYIDNVRTYQLCSGAPTAGSAGASPAYALTCAPTSTTLSLTGHSTGPGITYQWKVATASASGPFSNVSGATSPTYVTPALNTTTYYKCMVTCTGSGLVDSTSVVTFGATFPVPVLSASTPYFCGTGGTTTVSVVPAQVANYTTFTWGVAGGSGTITSSTTYTANFNVTSTSAISFTADDGAGCIKTGYLSVGVYSSASATPTITNSPACGSTVSTIGSGLSASSFSVSSVPYAYETPVGATTLVTNGVASVPLTGGSLDDGGWSGIPIGFNFNFFGNTYSTLSAGTNGLLMFGTPPGYGIGAGQLGQYSFTNTPATFPNAANPGNVIALLIADWYFGAPGAGTASGTIRYWTTGFAPDRKFVIEYDNVDPCCSNGATGFSAQCILYETTGIVEINLISKSTTNTTTCGLQDATKTIGAVAPGRQAFATTITTPERWRFTPPGNYSVSYNAVATGANIAGTYDQNGLNFAAGYQGVNRFSALTTTLGVGTYNIPIVYTNLTNGCSNSASPAIATITVLPVPSVVNASDVSAYGSYLGAGSATTGSLTICGQQTVTAEYNGPLAVGQTVRWWSASTGGTLLGSDTIYTTPSPLLVGSSYSVWLDITNGTCTSPSRTQFTVTNNTPPAMSLSFPGYEGDLVRCDNTGGTTLYTQDVVGSTSGYDTYTWTALDTLADVFTASSNTLSNWSTYVTTTARYSVSNSVSGCFRDTTVALSIFDIPLPAFTASDDTVCVGGTATINSGVSASSFSVVCKSSYGGRTPVGATVLADNGVALVAQSSGTLDDGGWGGIPIGFTFNYFGTTFTTVNIGTNGTVNFGPYGSFNAAQFSFSTWPSVSNPFNTIAVIAQDMDFRNGSDVGGGSFNITGVNPGSLRYWTEGVSPSRVFVVEYDNVPAYSNNGNQSVQLHLFETTGVVEIHAAQALSTSGKSIALQNGNGTIGSAAPRCNVPGQFWNGNAATISPSFKFAWKFSPPVNYAFAWTPAGEISGATNGSSITAAPTALVNTLQPYGLSLTDNTSGCIGQPDTFYLQVIAPPVAPTVYVTPSFTAGGAGANSATFCGAQNLSLAVTAGANPGDIVRYYNVATGGTAVFTANPWNAAYVMSNMSAQDTVWAAVDNGRCIGPRQMVVLNYQTPDAITITNSSPINCGTGPFSASLTASSTAPYAYEWNNNVHLSDTLGASVTVSGINFTQIFTVQGNDGYCYNSQSSSVSVYAFPVVNPTSQFDSICAGGTSLLNANVPTSGFTVTSQGYSPLSPGVNPVTFLCTNGGTANGGTELPYTAGFSLDDCYWTVPIGFTIDFFGTNYSSCYVGSNGVVMFSNPVTTFTPVTIPSASLPNDYAALFWGDLGAHYGVAGSISYYVTGSAPNRAFVVRYDVPKYGYSGTSRLTGQLEFYETSGNVEAHISEVTNPSFGGTVCGVEDITGTIGSAAPGRNAGIWQVTTPEGWIFSPEIPYTYQWLPSAQILGSDTTEQVTAQPSVSTNYQLIVTDNLTGCDNSVNNQSFVNVQIVSAPPVANFTASPLAGTSGGIITTHTLDVAGAIVGGDTYQWTITPATFAYVNGTGATDDHIEVQFTAAGSYSVQLIVNRCTGSDTAVINNLFTIIPVYCFPTFTWNGDGCSDGDAVDDVTIKDVNNVTIMSHLNTGCGGGANGYQNYMTSPVLGTTTCNLVQGSTYTIEVSSVSALYPEGFGVWLDVNDDGDFADAGEFCGSSAPAISATFNIGIPSSNVSYGLHRMRVIAAYATTLGAGDFCYSGTYGETHDYNVNIIPPVISNDIPTFAALVQYSSNMNYPNCAPVTGSTALATNSPESAASTGPDLWYRFVAQSTGVSIQLTSTTMDDAIALYTKDLAGNYNLVAGGTENASTGLSDFERLNIGGLTPGTTYYVSVGAASGLTGGSFTICIQHLMKSWCAFTIPVGGFDLCASYKAIYRGSPAQGVTYNFNFTGTGGTAPLVTTSLTGTNGLTTLSQPSLALRYGGVYNAKVDVVYSLSPSSGTDAPITVLGSVTDANCTGVTIRTQPLLEVRANQRCTFPATLLRSSWLVGVPVSGSNNVCSAINYTYKFRQVASCGGGYVQTDSTFYTTIGNTPFLQLGVLPNLPNQGAWEVSIRPNFTYGNGVFGPTQRIVVNGTSASATLDEESNGADAEKNIEFGVAANLYPNPNTGEIVNLNVSGVESDNVFVRIVDAMGRVVYSNRYTVDGSLNTVVTFAEPLASGLYSVEFHVDGDVLTERMIVTKQ